ncbi:MAG: CaiB/BaiF CoA transferase family protein [Alphaproteobacteria bacterium]
MSQEPVRALDGIRVLDLSRVLAGPLCTVQLSDLGAEIIKVEHPDHGDDTRGILPEVGGESHFFLSANRNKKSVALNLATDEGRDIIHQLADKCDVLIENFRTGVMARHGLDYDAMKDRHPHLVYCSISAYGRTGPKAKWAGFDPILQAESGMMSFTGDPDGDPTRHPLSIIDTYTSLYATQSIMACLMVKQRTGRGQFIDLALMDCAMAVLTNVGTNYLLTGNAPGRYGNMHPTTVPNGLFYTKTAPLYIAVGNPKLWMNFCDGVLEMPELKDDPRFKDRPDRLAHRAELVGLLNETFITQPCEFWLERLRRHGVPGGAVQSVPEALDAPDATERGMITSIDHPTVEGLRLIGSPIHMSESYVPASKAPPLLGQHTESVLSDVLGLGPDDFEKLRANKTIR